MPYMVVANVERALWGWRMKFRINFERNAYFFAFE